MGGRKDTEDSLFKKSLVFGMIVLFVGVSLTPLIGGIEIDFKGCEYPVQTKQVITSASIESNWPFLGIFLMYINGVGETSSSLQTFNRSFRFNLLFEFINNASLVQIRWPLFSLFPWEEWNFTGPGKYNAFLFFGSVNEINPSYKIEGYCLRLEFQK